MQTPEEKINQCTRLYSQSQIQLAKTCFLQILKTHKEHPIAHYNLGTIYKNLKHTKNAINHFRKAIQFDPKLIPAYNNLALCLKDNGDINQAISTYKQALKIAPNNASSYHNLGNIYQEILHLHEAVDCYFKARNLDSNNPNIHANLGATYLLLGQSSNAQQSLLQALNLAPNSPRFLFLLGHAYYKNNQFSEAIKCYQKTIALNPNYDLAHSCLFMAKRRICEWKGMKFIDDILDKTHNQDPWGSVVRSENPITNLEAAKAWSKRIENSVIKPHFIFVKTKNSHHKIRLGYISCNFADHPVGHMMTSLLQSHSKQFEVFAYSYGNSDHSVCRKNIEKLADQFVDLNDLSDLEAAQKIYADKIDILIDLTGYTEGNRLEICAMRPAKIQTTWAELLGTSGSSFFDYNIVDKIVVPYSEKKYYTEKLVYLPKCFYLRKNNTQFPQKQFIREDFGLPPKNSKNKSVIFGIFHQMFKIEPIVWNVWMSILKAVPNSVLWLWEQNKEGSTNLRKYAKKAGVDPKRLIFAKTMNADDFFARLPLADIALDTIIYGGGITTYQTLAAGVPVISLRGAHMASCLGASILTKAGLPELITHAPQEYKNLAIELTQNPQKLVKIKLQLTPKKLKKTLLNTTHAIKDLEKAYVKMWNTYQNNNQPQEIII